MHVRKHRDEREAPAPNVQPAKECQAGLGSGDDRWVSDFRNDLAALSLSTDKRSCTPVTLGELWEDTDPEAPKVHNKLC